MIFHDVLAQLEKESYLKSSVFPTPPGDGRLSDKDSGDEDDVWRNINKMTRRHLLTEVEYRTIWMVR